jgi:demethylmenaquinone methyltransferase/2-methoxy-6-polyprenyl-1,4-benzoquinol methylase
VRQKRGLSADPTLLIGPYSDSLAMNLKQSTEEFRMNTPNPTHFGFRQVAEADKARCVAGVFDSVFQRYDLMNDLMSGGLHRLWKAFAVERSGVREGSRVLDVAGGTGDLSLAFARRAGQSGQVWLTDINNAMLTHGRDRLADRGCLLPVAQCDAEKLPFPEAYFDCVSVAFGLRNMTRKERALAEMFRVLRPGGRLLVLEFSRIWKPFAPLYDFYSFKVIPRIGKLITQDEASYRYLAESIRVHPDQPRLKAMMEEAGFENVDYFNLTMGVVALHRGFKF